MKKGKRERDQKDDGPGHVILCVKSIKPKLLRAEDPKPLIGNQNSYQLFNRYSANQQQRRRHGRRGALREEGDRGGTSCILYELLRLIDYFFINAH